jgi:hypothetical protein
MRNEEWIRPGDKELRFVTEIGGKNFEATFKLDKLRFGGRLEY